MLCSQLAMIKLFHEESVWKIREVSSIRLKVMTEK